LNYFSKTEIEQHENNKRVFQKLMPVLRGLSQSEVEILLHKIRNSNSNLADTLNEELLTDSVHKTIETELAKLSED
jgi:hypothetical protein